MLEQIIKKLIFASVFLIAFAGLSQEYNAFDIRYQDNIKGDLTFIGNQILNRDGGTTTTGPTDPYNNLSTDNNNNPETGGWQNYNDYKQMQNINVDPGGGRFNSSSATFAFPNPDCNAIRYAGLYWSATYPSATANGSYDGVNYSANTVPVGTGRQNDFNQVQFRVPNGGYVAVVADEILFDGITSTDPSVLRNSPYACYADVTNLVRGVQDPVTLQFPDPTGDYTVANIRATTGGLTPGGGSTGGWTLVVVYENPTVTGKLITTFDGFARVRGTDNIDINYNGFTTIPAGPVNANIGAAALEGDYRITGDFMSISAASNFPTFTTMSNTSNPANNFFNSNITLNGAELPGRTPSSLNTLGFDIDIFDLGNFGNSIIPNNETSATFRFGTNGDQYYPYFNSFNIEIIEPDIVLEKRVEDIAGNDITGLGVNLGQVLDYVLTFRNIGNDDGTNFTIRDVLPINVTLDEANFVLPAGVTYVYTPATRTVVFSVPENLIEAGDLPPPIRMRVQVAENCFDFIDACTDLIQNLAYSTYEGVVNDNQITDDPSVTLFNNCQPPVPGATNFLLDDLSDCNFTRTVQLCGDDVLLDAGDNFDSYIWVSDDNNNGLFDPTDTVLNDGDPDNDPSTLLVNQEGTYIVDKIVADPCKGFKEIMVVERFGSSTINPIIDYFNTVNGDADVTNDIQGEIVTCGIDGDELAKIFLCGTNDSALLQTNITDAQTISWELLDETSCSASPDDCANKNLGCVWNQVATGTAYNANTAGKYRLVVTYQNGCFNRFYFDVFQNILDIQYNSSDIICTTNGSINITNIGGNYGFQLVDITNNNILVPFSANNGPNFTITSNGAYRVDVVQLDGSGNPIANACVFSTPDIGILDRDFQVLVNTTAETCNSQGTIRIDILNIEPNYTYTLRRSDGTLIDDETAQTDNTHIFNVNAGDYIIEAASDDGCFYTQPITVNRIPDPTISALTTRDIGCSAGTIEMTAAGGFPNPDYGFAIWSKNGIDLYGSVASIPGGAYQVETTFTFGWRDTDSDGIDEYFSGEDGTYVFIVIDANGCFAFSNEVVINDNGPMTLAPTNSDIICSGSSTASLTIGTSGGVGPFMYSINDGTNYQSIDTFVNLAAGTYNLRVTDSSGCEVDQIYTITEPFTLSASAGVTEVVECNPTTGAEVRITNAQGGTAPYEYSFNGGATYGPSNIASLPAGTHNLVIRDAADCEYPMTVVVPDPVIPPTFDPVVTYECDGEGTITVNSTNTTNFDYTYELNTVLNTPADSNVFNNVPVGTQTVTVNYTSNTIPAPSQLLLENFGVGPTTSITEVDPNYCYEPLDGTTTPCNLGPAGGLVNGEYTVTSEITGSWSGWTSPNDRSLTPNGRFLAIDLGTVAGLNGIIYAKRDIEIIPNRDLTISLAAFNLVRAGQGGTDVEIRIELVDNLGNVVSSILTGDIPKNTSADDWYDFSFDLDPGANSTIDIVFRTQKNTDSGNDLAVDNILATQAPLICSSSVDIPVVIEAGRAFEANFINATNVSCNGLSDGTITFEVENFDPTDGGFDYSVDNRVTWINSTISPTTTNPVFDAGTHTIYVRRNNEQTCELNFDHTITEPNSLVADAVITTDLTCTNGATITASAIGGTPNYTYQLEDNLGAVIAPFDFTNNGANTIFTNLPAGDYIVRVRDNNDTCEDAIDTALTITAANTIVFDVTPTNCYSGANDASLVVNVTDGNGGYTFSINGDPWVTPTPTTATTYTFDNLANGNYTINVSDALGCIGVLQNITINPQLTVSANAPRLSACDTDGAITITADGGDTNYIYAVVSNGTTVVDGDFSTTNPATGFVAGTYDVYVRDNNGAAGYCFAMSTITIEQDTPILTTISPTSVSCSGGSDGSISITVDSGGATPFEYSIDNGVTYQISNNFPNLSAGTYQVRVRDNVSCETASQDIVVLEPAALVAFAAVTELVECNPTAGAEVRITNPSGGTPTYEYSFNSGLSFGPSSISNLPAGDHVLVIRDANDCTFEMTVTVEPQPTPPNFSDAITYDCTGEGEITITPDNTGFDYTYSIDGTPNTPDTSNIFSNVAVGTHTITVNYQSNLPVSNSILLLENFGNGAPTSITEIDPLFCFEPQNGGPSSCPSFGTDTHIQDGEYSVANTIINPYTWLVPNEQSGTLDGRYLAINIGGVAGANGIIYAKRNIEVIPNSDITISLEAFNLKFVGSTGADPDLDIQLVNGLGTVIASLTTGNIPKSTDPDIWENYSVTLNPGAETNLDIVIRTNGVATGGNDVVLDNILAVQTPIQCPSVDTFNVIVEDGYAFEASITAFENLDCNADSSGTITIFADNFGAGGYEYSLDATTFVGPFTTNQQITGLSAQAHTITVRDVVDPVAGCTVTLNQTLTEPTPIVADASITEAFTCDNTGATITASATGGTPTYEYQLEDNIGGIITAYQTGITFTNLAAGDYIIRARDINSCADPIDTAISVVAPINPTFTVTPTACYSGANDASILVDVTSVPGNAGFQFSLDAGPWITPTPATATSHIFDNLANGTYTIDVRDSYGCQAPQQSVTINPQLTGIVDVVAISLCADGNITVTPSGGDSTYSYAFVAAGTAVTASDFGASNTIAISAGNHGNYDVYVWDNNAASPHCEYMETVTVDPATPITFTATPTDPECHDGVGSIELNITSGDIPYQIRIVDLSNAGASDQTVTNILGATQSFYNLSPGVYELYVQDTNGCEVQLAPNVTINNPDELTGSVSGVTPSACTGDPNDFGFEFVSYTTTLGTIEFSADGGTTWIGDNSNPGVSDNFTGYNSGDTVFPSMRTVSGGVTICQTDLPPFVIPYPLDDLDITVTAVIVNCNELQVTVQGAEGTPNYQYTYSEDASTFNPAAPTHPWSTPAKGLADPHVFTGLIPGREYVFYVRDSSTPAPGCIRQSNVNVNDLIDVPLEITSAFEPSCSGANDGTITYTIADIIAPIADEFRWTVYDISTGTPVSVSDSGGNQPYSSPQDVTVSGLAPGDYFIIVTEVNGGVDGCVGATENLLLEELNPITATLNKLSDISCNSPGLISVDNINGGGGTFTYTVTGPATFTTISGTTDNPIAIPANSPAGDYFVRVTDQFGCFADFGPINLTLTANPTIDTMVVDNCATPTSLTITATSTAAQILYSIDGGTNYVDNGGVFNNLAPGPYNVAIIDSNGCTDTDTIEIYPVLEANATLTKLIDCTVSPDAEITIDITFGSGDYDYEITNSLGGVIARTSLPSNPYVFSTSVVDPSYTITIYDNNTDAPECNRVFNIAVPAAVLPAFTEAHTDVTCNGSTDGTITLTETLNGINPLSYSISPVAGSFNSATKTFENLPTGTYTVTGTGSNSCEFDIIGIFIGEPVLITIPLPTIVEFGCATGNNSNNATITITAPSGGSNNFVRYEFINDQGTPATGDDVVVQNGSTLVYTETNIVGGTYIINAYDDKGCVGTTTATILPYVSISDPTATITQDLTCNPGNDAQVTIGITITPASGATDLAYSVTGTDNAYNAPNQASNVFNTLSIGNYLVTVTNNLTGCTVQTTFEIEDPNTYEIATTTTDVVCFGDDGTVSFTISDVINPYVGVFTWQIYDSQGTVPFGDDVLVVGAAGVSANVGPTTPFAIAAGEYRVEITQDSDPSCINNAFFTIAGPSTAITADTEVTPITCVGNDGVIEIIDVLGGWGDYQYYVGTVAPTVVGDYVANPRFDILAPGTYQVWVLDQNGCQAEVQSPIVLADPTPIDAQLQLNQPNCPNFSGEIEVINVTGGQGSNYTFQLIKDGTAIGAPQNTTIFSGLDAGSYTVQINDQWTCTFTTLAELLYEPIVPLATVVKTIDCTIDPGGQVTITQTGGSGNFTYSVVFPDSSAPLPSNTTGVFTTLTQVGDYVFTITDQAIGHACPVSITQNIQDRILPVLSVDAFTNVTCNGSDDGTISVSVPDNGIGPYTFTVISGPGSSATFPIASTTPPGTNGTFTGLEGTTSGITYTIEVRGTNNCVDTISQVITEPELITGLNVSVLPFECTSGNNPNFATLSIDAGLVGGSNNFVRYRFVHDTSGNTVQDGANDSYTETNLLGGDYTITVFDDNGCEAATTAVINPFVAISDAVITTTAIVTCGGNDSEIQVSVTMTPAAPAIMPTLEYSVTGTDNAYNDTNNSGTFINLGVGNFIVTITNLTTGCIIETTHTIADPDVIEAVIEKISDNPCLDDAGGFDVSAINNYSGGYSYQVFDINDVAVPGAAFSGNSSTASLPLEIRGLSGGGYYITITETDPGSTMCSDESNAITIIEPADLITFTPSEEASVSCSNDQGVILIDPTGGNGPYNIELINTTTGQPPYVQNGVEAAQFTGLSAGVYNINVSDALNCIETGTITLVRPEDFLPTISSTPLVCFNANDATVFTTEPAGRNVSLTAAYEYQLNTYDLTGTTLLQTSAVQRSFTFTGLSAGFYSITTSDNFGCSFTSPIEEIVNPTEVIAQLIRTSPVTCLTGVELQLSASGGASGTYEYRRVGDATWLPMPGSSIDLPITGILPADTYRYEVRDGVNNCDAVLSNEIVEDPIIPLAWNAITDSDAIACFGGSTGRISAFAEFGMGNYQYELYFNANGGQAFSDAAILVPSQTSGEFSGLSVGFYFVRATSGDCILDSNEIPITESPLLEVVDPDNFTNVLCNGDLNGTITVELTGGAGGYQYAISPNLNQFDETNTFVDLAPGNYTVIAQDQNGCFIQLEYTISEPIILSATATTTPEICEGDENGVIDLTITGGTAPFSTRFSSESNFVLDRLSFPNMVAGGYIIFVRDANGCEFDLGVIVDPGVNLNAEIDPVYECTGDTPDNYINITFEDPSVMGDVLYALDSTDPNDLQLNFDFRNIEPGMHFITLAHSGGCPREIEFEIEDFEPLTLSLASLEINLITATAAGGKEDYTYYFNDVNNGNDNTYRINRTDTYVVRVVDENGCEVTSTIEMEFLDIEIPNFFTPDGDGQNDFWKPRNQEAFPEILTLIFDRYGREVYRLGLNDQGWDGLYNENELPTGDYWYVIKLKGEIDDREFIGHFTLYR